MRARSESGAISPVPRPPNADGHYWTLSDTEVRRAQVESFEGGQILRAERCESIEQLFERLATAFFFLSETVEGIERDGFTVFEDAFGTGHPIGALTDNEVSHGL